MELVLDALFCASTIMGLLYKEHKRGTLVKGHRLFRIAWKAWARYNRRAAWFPGVSIVNLPEFPDA